MKKGYVYILTNKTNKVLYIGVTSNIENRINIHKQKLAQGFTQKYNLTKLIHLEEYQTIQQAIEREKQLKNWKRQWKLDLIKLFNPSFKDLSG